MLDGRICIEIGGPSEVFSDEGFLSIYSVLGQLDNCLFSAETIWANGRADGSYWHPSLKRPGRQLICDATEMRHVTDGSYEAVLASHCLEHVANPLRALAEWRRVLKPGGLLLLVLPQKEATFDWRRPTTTISHMIDDFERNIGEDDLTHLDEVARLHDMTRDSAAGSRENFLSRCRGNYVNRAMHHHVFVPETAIEIVEYAGFHVIRADTFEAFHIVLIAEKPD